LKKPIFMTVLALAASALTLTAQDASRFNGTWKGSDNGQVRKLTYKDGVVHMEETQANGRVILRDYPADGQEITMNLEGVWNGSKATGKMEGNKPSVDTEMPNGTKFHDEWTLAEDGKSYSAVRVMTAVGTGGPFGRGGGGQGRAAGRGPGAGRGRAGGGGPETFTKID
jgi:cell division protein FtsW (lipid II flippase)